MAYLCSFCNKKVNGKKIYPNYLCEVCYSYFLHGGTINPLPPRGTIAYDKNGYVICHICGKAFKKLGSHVYLSHRMTTDKYKALFGLCRNAKLTERLYSKKMHDLAYINNMPEQLKKVGISTRIQKGETRLCLGKIIRLQERLNKKARLESDEGIK